MLTVTQTIGGLGRNNASGSVDYSETQHNFEAHDILYLYRMAIPPAIIRLIRLMKSVHQGHRSNGPFNVGLRYRFALLGLYSKDTFFITVPRHFSFIPLNLFSTFPIHEQRLILGSDTAR